MCGIASRTLQNRSGLILAQSVGMGIGKGLEGHTSDSRASCSHKTTRSPSVPLLRYWSR